MIRPNSNCGTLSLSLSPSLSHIDQRSDDGAELISQIAVGPGR